MKSLKPRCNHSKTKSNWFSMTLTGKRIVTRHGKINYYESGEGPPLVLLHATPRSALSFHQIIPQLRRFHKVIAPDTLGFGLSDPLPKSANIKLLADSIKQLLEKLQIKQCCVFGLHTGNKIAAALANQAPGLINRLIICGMTHSIIPEKAPRINAIQTLLNRDLTKNMILSTQEFEERQIGKKSQAELYQANYAFDICSTIQKVSMPTLIIELATTNEQHLGIQGSKLAKCCPTASSTILYGSDREFLEKNPAKLANSILAFTSC
jgi:pimeloyl-ACP methyl ester carboxylesterase